MPSGGIGLSAAANLNEHLALDVTANTTLAVSRGVTDISGGRASELLSGLRAEIRARHYGYFLHAQPGFLTWSDVITSAAFTPPTTLTFTYGRRYRFVSAVGAGFEYSPSSRVHIRGEVSDLVERYSRFVWLNNLQPTAGIYVGVGKPVEWRPPVYESARAHPFFGRANVVLFTGSVLSIIADGVTTQRFIAQGEREGDPIARPLVKYGWSGQISETALEASGEAAVMYGLHRIGHHWIERMMPVCVATAHGVLAYDNSKVNPRGR